MFTKQNYSLIPNTIKLYTNFLPANVLFTICTVPRTVTWMSLITVRPVTLCLCGWKCVHKWGVGVGVRSTCACTHLPTREADSNLSCVVSHVKSSLSTLTQDLRQLCGHFKTHKTNPRLTVLPIYLLKMQVAAGPLWSCSCRTLALLIAVVSAKSVY